MVVGLYCNLKLDLPAQRTSIVLLHSSKSKQQQ